MPGPEILKWPLAVAAAVAATVAISFLLKGGDAGGGGGERGDPAGNPAPQVRGLIRDMSARQKAEGVMVVAFSGTDATAPIFARLGAEQPGGVLVSGRNWTDPVQGAGLTAELRAAAARRRVPPFVVASQEGGSYRDLRGIGPARTEAEVGIEGSSTGARRWAFRSASELRRSGFDLNLGLVADVAPLDSPVGDRSFGGDPAPATRMVAAAVRGCRAGGLLCGLRHFPGQGGASADTDIEPATVGLTEAELEQRDLAAFRAGMRAGARVVVVSHAIFSAFDPVTPGSLSPQVAGGLLRKQLRFTGVAVTDDLISAAARAGRDAPTAAVDSLAAGADMVLVGSPGPVQRRVRDAIVRAVESGRLAERRLDDALSRILELKRSRGLLARG